LFQLRSAGRRIDLFSGQEAGIGQKSLPTSGQAADVQIFEERTKGWICATGKKPSAAA
jgi:hypothetical protein